MLSLEFVFLQYENAEIKQRLFACRNDASKKMPLTLKAEQAKRLVSEINHSRELKSLIGKLLKLFFIYYTSNKGHALIDSGVPKITI